MTDYSTEELESSQSTLRVRVDEESEEIIEASLEVWTPSEQFPKDWTEQEMEEYEFV